MRRRRRRWRRRSRRRSRRNVLQQFDESVKGERKQRCGTEDRQIDQHRGSICINNSQCCGFAVCTSHATAASSSNSSFGLRPRGCLRNDRQHGGKWLENSPYRQSGHRRCCWTLTSSLLLQTELSKEGTSVFLYPHVWMSYSGPQNRSLWHSLPILTPHFKCTISEFEDYFFQALCMKTLWYI